MNKEECKYCTYLKKCPNAVESGSIYCLTHRQIPKNINKSYEELQQENEKYKEVIDKLKDKTKENIEKAKCEVTTLTIGDKAYYQYIEKMLDNYVDMLKEVE